MKWKISYKEWLLGFFSVIFWIGIFTTASASTLQEYFDTGDDGSDTGTVTAWHAQNFTAVSSYTLDSIAFLISCGTCTGTVGIDLYAIDGSNKPTGTSLSSGTISSASLSGTPAWISATMSAYSIVSGTTYAIVVSQISSGTNSLRYDNANGYAGAKNIVNLSTDSGATWSNDTADDFLFRVYSSTSGGGSIPSWYSTSTPETDAINRAVVVMESFLALIAMFLGFLMVYIIVW